MQISDEQLDQFIALYKQEFGEELPRAKAYDSAMSLIRLLIFAAEGGHYRKTVEFEMLYEAKAIYRPCSNDMLEITFGAP